LRQVRPEMSHHVLQFPGAFATLAAHRGVDHS
jgi:hypothetical protein